ncbi:hypothetical protein QSU92_03715 [Microbacterium sp. ET2]|uniref:hypothetical protein n=1 Tax=Microbacterium albipurpureum TaxID=3050384 RepID=UPI00259CC33A|nr:hypothetical protein [Microbacterium sp. ET2 (Ac-2212)]WJL96308.1 hypothetical protein QSU92_03715 [Microbacterium sp. ET2 (Ac-2212)]
MSAPRSDAVRRDAATGETRPRRGVVLTVVVVLVYIIAFAGVALGILVLLSRYDVADDEVLPVSLLGASIILFGLLVVALASALARGSRLARSLLTGYVALLVALQVVTIVSSDTWDIPATVQLLVQVIAVILVWVPPASRYFTARAARPAAIESVG